MIALYDEHIEFRLIYISTLIIEHARTNLTGSCGSSNMLHWFSHIKQEEEEA